MWKDEVLEEIYKIREEHAKAFNYDLKAICDDLRRKQVQSGRKMISIPLKKKRLLHHSNYFFKIFSIHDCSELCRYINNGFIAGYLVN